MAKNINHRKKNYIMKNELIKQVRELQNFLIQKVTKAESGERISNQEVRLINEALNSLSFVIQNLNIEPHQKVILQKTYRIALDVAYEKLFYYSSYYYSYEEISKGKLNKQQKSLFQINVSTATMISVIEGYNNGITGIGGSTDNYYAERMIRVLWALKYVLKNSLEELFIPSLYVTYNLSQSLSLYIESGHQEYSEKAIDLLNSVQEILSKFHSLDSVKRILSENTQLDIFRIYQNWKQECVLAKEKTSINIEISNFDKLKSENSLRILSSLYFLDKKQFISLFEEKFNLVVSEISKQRIGLNNFLFVKNLAHYMFLNGNEPIELDLDPLRKGNLDFSKYINDVFKDYNQSANISLSEDELPKLLNYDDDTLRAKVAETILNVDKHILNRESKKPHGVSEISDMEIPIRLEDEHYYMCMPFKSGREISSNTVPVGISYQIFRPFLHFDNCVVVFVSAKRASQPLMNYIKKMQSKLGWNIAVIENEELAKLLKQNGLLT